MCPLTQNSLILCGDDMSCFHPIKAIQYKTRNTVRRVVDKTTGEVTEIVNPFKHPIRILKVDERDKEWSDDVEVIYLPCGKCNGCRMDYAHQWANRLMLELEAFKNDPNHTGDAYFVTLTIADTHINDIGDSDAGRRGDQKQLHVLRPYEDPDNNLLNGWSRSVSKVDLQLFMKRLRRYHPDDKIRFFACGEYGSRSSRPHYHLILFGLTLDDNDLTFYKKSGLGYDYMNSKYISKCWPFGFNVVAPVTWESCCYVSRYMLKKNAVMGKDGKSLYDKFNMEAPFVQMSRRPGIAKGYFQTLDSSVYSTRLTIGTSSGSYQFNTPRYFEKIFDEIDPVGSEMRRRLRRLSAKNHQVFTQVKTDLDSDEYLRRMEQKFRNTCLVLDSYRDNMT